MLVLTSNKDALLSTYVPYVHNLQAVSNLTNFTIFGFSLSRCIDFTIFMLRFFDTLKPDVYKFYDFQEFSFAFYKFSQCK